MDGTQVTGRKLCSTMPTPTYMTEDQKSSYLEDLRSNRPTRPNRPIGSRPPPFKTPHLTRSESAASIESHGSKTGEFASPRGSLGRPLVSAMNSTTPSLRGRVVSPTAAISRVGTDPAEYTESATRKLEKEEAHTLRKALHLIDQRDEEKRIYDAAQAEAADLVWKHQNPHAAEEELTAPYINPDLVKSRSRNVSDSSSGSAADAPVVSKRASRARDKMLSEALQELQIASEERSAAIAASAKERRRSSGKRLVSGGSISNKTLFRNPKDHIFEEPKAKGSREGETTAAVPVSPLKDRSSNPVPPQRPAMPRKMLSTPAKKLPWLNRVEIHKNPPTQSRNAAYTSNTAPPVPKKDDKDDKDDKDTSNADTPKSATGLEIRSDDIRAATSMKKKDRSPKLPTPVAISDLPGRPIVSFDPAWKAKNSPRSSVDIDVSGTSHSRRGSRDLPPSRPHSAQTHSHSYSAPVVPLINVSDCDAPAPVPEIKLPSDRPNIPIIQTEDADDMGPTISVTAPPPAADAAAAAVNEKPQQSPSKGPSRPLPVHSATMPLPARSSRPSWMNGHSTGLPTAVSCTACCQPISGRIVTAAGSKSSGVSLRARFHPDCFRCAHCSTRLEAVAFYPEPDEARQGRIDESEQPEVEEASVRFYCHLDFHELFSPRCRSCKTPIEGAVVNACGHTYHQDHFFCAECGNPFDSTTPFVEHNGYAYCVSCHTRRTSARCRSCKQVILDELTVEALGGKWHERCFVCDECGGDFGSEGRFFIRDVAVQPTDKERRKGITKKMEERAVCQACEEIRLKA